MAIYKIFPTKDTSLYTISQSMNTGLDEIIEASTYIENNSPQVSRYLMQFSQIEINNWVKTYISGSSVSAIRTVGTGSLTGNRVPPTINGPTFPTGSWPAYQYQIQPSSSTGNGVGLTLDLQTGPCYFINGVNISASNIQMPNGILEAPDGVYGPLVFTLGPSSSPTLDNGGATVNITLVNKLITNVNIVNNGSTNYGTFAPNGNRPSYGDPIDYPSTGDATDVLYLTSTNLMAAGIDVIGGVSDLNDAIFSISTESLKESLLLNTITRLQTKDNLPKGTGYQIGDILTVPSSSWGGSDDYYFNIIATDIGDVKFAVDLRNSAAVVNGLGMDQVLKVYPISGSWSMGTGKFYNNPGTVDGSSWTYRNYSSSVADGSQMWNMTGALRVGALLTSPDISTPTVGVVTSIDDFAAVGNNTGINGKVTLTSTLVNGVIIISSVSIVEGGSDFAPGETITITAATIAATAFLSSSSDLIITINSSFLNLGNNATVSYVGNNKGGGNWYTGSNLALPVIQSQSFSYGIGVDLKIDVTNTIKTWYTNSLVNTDIGFPNDGFLIKQSSSREFVNAQATTATFRYFSIDTNTIYPPLLDLKWVDYSWYTGSSTNTILNTPESFMSVYNNVGTYYSQSVERFRIAAIPKYPDIVFQTSSLYTTNYYLPMGSSSYAIKDTDTNEFVVPFDETYTQISADGTSSYFDVYMNGLEPERYYTILIKTTLGGTTQVFDEDINFKLING